jgi:hypothetical protein
MLIDLLRVRKNGRVNSRLIRKLINIEENGNAIGYHGLRLIFLMIGSRRTKT